MYETTNLYLKSNKMQISRRALLKKIVITVMIFEYFDTRLFDL